MEIIKKVRRLNKNKIEILIYIFLILAICWVHACRAQELIDFFPTNGTFQNFNPVRRLLSGQVPYSDFNDYLGMGHLLWGSIATFLWGGTFAASMSAFTFLTILSMVSTALILGHSIFRSWKPALQGALIILVASLIPSHIVGPNQAMNILYSCTAPGNSARLIRAAATVIFLSLLLIGNAVSERWERFKSFKPSQKRFIYVAYTGLCGGIMFSHSNDYGISSWLCFGLTTAFISFAYRKKLLDGIKYFLLYLGFSFVGLCCFITLVTRGNLLNWIKLTFGTGNYQSWYYLSDRAYFLFDVDFSLVPVLQAIFVLIYLFKLYYAGVTRASIIRYGIPAVMNMTAFCAVNEYRLLSGGSMTEMSWYLLMINIIYEVIAYVWNMVYNPKTRRQIKRLAALAIIPLSCASLFSNGFVHLTIQMDSSRGTYFENLDGYMNSLSESVASAEEFLGDKAVFSTYSTALEAETGQFQPSGYDYIIHVLGESARQEYLASFQEKNFDYVTTIRKNFTSWEDWIEAANWFFYQQLHKNYHPVFANEYQIFWEENSSEQNFSLPGDAVNVSLEWVDETSCKIIVKGDSSLNGIANVHLSSASIPKRDSLYNSLLFNSLVFISDSPHSVNSKFNLPSKSDSTIPVYVRNGYGEFTVSSMPENATLLSLENVSCDEIYTAASSFLYDIEVVPFDEDSCVIVAATSQENQGIANGVKAVSCGGKTIPVTEVSEEGERIQLFVDTTAEDLNTLLNKSNCIQVVK